MTSEILNLWGYIWDADEALENAISAVYDMFRGVDSEIAQSDPTIVELDAYCDQLVLCQKQIKSGIPTWLKEGAEAEEELLADLDARADALSY